MTDKASLWDKLKSELEAEAEGHIVRERVYDSTDGETYYEDKGYQRDERAQAILDRMLQMETLS